ncbi:MAG: hypothetical protein ACI9KE_001571 [Polyangiales bacterium]
MKKSKFASALGLICAVALQGGVLGGRALSQDSPASSSLASTSRAQRVEGVAVRVGEGGTSSPVVFLLSDVELRARLRLAGESRGPLPMNVLPAELLRATLEELVGEALISREAERVQLPEPSDNAIRREVRRLENLGGGSERAAALLHAMGASLDELRASARRRAQASIFLESNLQADAAVDDLELERVYESGEHPFIGQELEDVREAMRVWLLRSRIAGAVERWVEALSARETIVYFAPYH